MSTAIRSDRARSIAQVAAPAAIGALFAYLFDPGGGRRRRRLARKRVKRYARAVGRRVKRAGRRGASGMRRTTHPQSRQEEPPDDVTLTRKVESEVFRDPDVPKGRMNVNAEDGVVFLRGRVDRPEQAEELERGVRAIPGVRGVQNHLEADGAA